MGFGGLRLRGWGFRGLGFKVSGFRVARTQGSIVPLMAPIKGSFEGALYQYYYRS